MKELEQLVKQENPPKTLIITPNNKAKRLLQQKLPCGVLPTIETIRTIPQNFLPCRAVQEVFFVVKLKDIINQYEAVSKRTANTLYTAELFLDEIRNVLLNLPYNEIYKLKNLLEIYQEYPILPNNNFFSKIETVYTEFVEVLKKFVEYLETNNLYLYELAINKYEENNLIPILYNRFDTLIIYDVAPIFRTEERFLKNLLEKFAQDKRVHIITAFEKTDNILLKNINNNFYAKYKKKPGVKFHYYNKEANNTIRKVFLNSYSSQLKFVAREIEKNPGNNLIVLPDNSLLFSLLNSVSSVSKSIAISILTTYKFFTITKVFEIVLNFIVYKKENYLTEVKEILFPDTFNGNEPAVELKANFLENLEDFINKHTEFDTIEKAKDKAKDKAKEILLGLYKIFEEQIAKDEQGSEDKIFTTLEQKFIKHFYKDIIEYIHLPFGEITGKDFLLYFLHLIKFREVLLSNSKGKLQISSLDNISVNTFDNIFIVPAEKDLLPRSYVKKHIILPQIKSTLRFASYNDVVKNKLYYLISTIHNTRNTYFIFSNKLKESNFSYAISFLYKNTEEKNLKNPQVPVNYDLKIVKTDEIIKKLQRIVSEGISLSVIREYIENPEKFIYERIFDTKYDNIPNSFDTKLDHQILTPLQKGTIAHNVLRKFYLNFSENINEPEGILKKFIEEELNAHENPKQPFIKIYKPYVETVFTKELSQKVVEPDKKKDIKLILTEKEFQVTFGNNYKFKGVIDKIIIQDKTLTITDYKTGEAKLTEKKIKAFISSGCSEETIITTNKKEDWETLQLISYLYLVTKNSDKIPDYNQINTIDLEIVNLFRKSSKNKLVKISMEEAHKISENFEMVLIHFIEENFLNLNDLMEL